MSKRSARRQNQPSQAEIELETIREKRMLIELERERIGLEREEARLRETARRQEHLSRMLIDSPYPGDADGVDIERGQAEVQMAESGAFGAYGFLDSGGPGSYPAQWGQTVNMIGQGFMNPLSTRVDRYQGRDRPFVVTEVDLSLQRGVARIILQTNCPAQGILNNLRNYVVGEKGYQYNVAAKHRKAKLPEGLVETVQLELDEFFERNKWPGIMGLEGELFYRSRRDGEYFAGMHCDHVGRTNISIIEPEQITDLGMNNFSAEQLAEQYGVQIEGRDDWTFGIHTPLHNVNQVYGYNSWWDDLSGAEYLPAACVQHLKLSEHNIKRGITDFYGALEHLQKAEGLISKTTSAAAVQASIAFIRQHAEGITQSEVASFRASKNDWSQSIYTPGGGNRTFQHYGYADGTVLDTPYGQEYKPGPIGTERNQVFVEVCQAVLRWVATKWSMPEFMVSSDASNASYSSTMVAESPFVKFVKGLQHAYGVRWLEILWRVIWNACRYGRFDRFGEYGRFDVLRKFLAIQVEYPQVETRDPQQETEIRQTLHDKGILSKPTWAAKEGLDYEEEVSKGAQVSPDKITGKASEMDAEGGVTALQAPGAGKQPGVKQDDPEDGQGGKPAPGAKPGPPGGQPGHANPRGASNPVQKDTEREQEPGVPKPAGPVRESRPAGELQHDTEGAPAFALPPQLHEWYRALAPEDQSELVRLWNNAMRARSLGLHETEPAEVSLTETEVALVEAIRHAPKGGVTIAGKKFQGGRFIPAADMAKASPQEKKVLADKTVAQKKGIDPKKVDQTAEKQDENPIRKPGESLDASVSRLQQHPAGRLPNGLARRVVNAITHPDPEVRERAANNIKRMISEPAFASYAEHPSVKAAIKSWKNDGSPSLRRPTPVQVRQYRNSPEPAREIMRRQFDFSHEENRDEAGKPALFPGAPRYRPDDERRWANGDIDPAPEPPQPLPGQKKLGFKEDAGEQEQAAYATGVRVPGISPEFKDRYEQAWNISHYGPTQDSGDRSPTRTEYDDAVEALDRMHEEDPKAADELNELLARRKEGPTREEQDEYEELYRDNLMENLGLVGRRRLRELENQYGEGAFEQQRAQESYDDWKREIESEREEGGEAGEAHPAGDADEVRRKAFKKLDETGKYGVSEATVQRAAGESPPSGVIGDHPTPQDVISLAGAPDDAQDVYYTTGPRAIHIEYSHPAIDGRAKRHIIALDGGGFGIHNDNFCLNEDYQGSGIGLDMVAREVENGIRMGAKFIDTHAARSSSMVGYYAWPRMGYDQSLDSLGELGERARRKFPDANSVLDVMQTEDGRDWWKRNGDDLTNAKFDLTPGSRSIAVLKAYLAERGHKVKPESFERPQVGNVAHESEPPDRLKVKDELGLSHDDEAALDRVWHMIEKLGWDRFNEIVNGEGEQASMQESGEPYRKWTNNLSGDDNQMLDRLWSAIASEGKKYLSHESAPVVLESPIETYRGIIESSDDARQALLVNFRTCLESGGTVAEATDSPQSLYPLTETLRYEPHAVELQIVRKTALMGQDDMLYSAADTRYRVSGIEEDGISPPVVKLVEV